MAEIIESGGGKKHGGKKRPKKHGSHIDMTPMVDLACLLLTFFMLTTAFSKPKVMEIVLPEKIDKEKDKVVEQKIDDSKVLNILLANGKVYWYNGLPKPGTILNTSDFSKDGIRKILLQRNKDLYLKIDQFNQDIIKGKIKMPKDSVDKKLEQLKEQDKKGPIVLIKAGKDVKYGNIVDVIDEMAICNISRYAIIDINPAEVTLIDALRGAAPVAKKGTN